MRRLTWFAVGAGAGIVAYRRAQRLRDQARADGLLPTVQRSGAAASTLAAGIAASLRGGAGGLMALAESSSVPVAGAAAARALQATRGGAR